MKCAVKLNRDNRLKEETTKQCIKFILIAIGMYLGDKRGWKPKRICEAIEWINKYAVMISEDLTTFKEAEEAFRESYGIHIANDGTIYYEFGGE